MAWLRRNDRPRESGAELVSQGLLLLIDEHVAEQEGVSLTRHLLGSIRKACEGGVGLTDSALIPLLAVEEDLGEGHPRRRADEVRTRLVEGAQFSFRWFGRADRVVEHKGHLLRQPAADDGVADIELQFPRLPGEHLLSQLICEETAEFLVGGWAMPLARPHRLQPIGVGRGDPDDLRRRGNLLIRGEGGVGGKQKTAEGKKVQQRFLQEVSRLSLPAPSSMPCCWHLRDAIYRG